MSLDPNGFRYLLRLFKYGTGNGCEGYWMNDHMMSQVDEFIDLFELKFPVCIAEFLLTGVLAMLPIVQMH